MIDIIKNCLYCSSSTASSDERLEEASCLSPLIFLVESSVKEIFESVLGCWEALCSKCFQEAVSASNLDNEKVIPSSAPFLEPKVEVKLENEEMLEVKKILLDFPIPDRTKRQILDFCKDEGSSVLNFHGHDLGSLPPIFHFSFFKRLACLDLEKNKLQELPAQIKHLSSLELLLLSNNELTKLPEEIGELSSLRSLIANDCQLTELPESVLKLKKLERLLARDNDTEKSRTLTHSFLRLQERLRENCPNLTEWDFTPKS